MVNCREFFPEGTTSTSSDWSLRYCVYVSGEHVELAKAELEAVCRLLIYDIDITWYGRLAVLDCTANPLGFILERAALVQEGGIVLGEAPSPDLLVDTISEEVFRQHVPGKKTFAIRPQALEGGLPRNERVGVETELGKHIQGLLGLEVSLDNPAALLRVFIHPKTTIICDSEPSVLRRLLRGREPGRKPFFHPSMMNATLSRVMCNLAGVSDGGTVLDPFCGGAGILCEAALLGARVVGVDSQWKMLVGARVNLSQVEADYLLVQGDARSCPVIACDALVTDPPYGRASSTRGLHSLDLITGLVRNLDSIVRQRGESTCICGSQKMGLSEVIREAGFTIGREIGIRVHSGLVREVVTVVL